MSSDILVLNSWTDVTMLSCFSSTDNVLKREPLWDAEVSALTFFRLWPMLALNVRLLIGHGFRQGDSSTIGRIPLSFKILEMRQQKGTHIRDSVHRIILRRTWKIWAQMSISTSEIRSWRNKARPKFIYPVLDKGYKLWNITIVSTLSLGRREETLTKLPLDENSKSYPRPSLSSSSSG